MKVKFANAEVDVWKLRPGVILRDYDNKYWHILGVTQVLSNFADLIVYDSYLTSKSFLTTELDWLEPH